MEYRYYKLFVITLHFQEGKFVSNDLRILTSLWSMFSSVPLGTWFLTLTVTAIGSSSPPAWNTFFLFLI